MKEWLIGILIVLLLLGGGGAYIKYSAIQEERTQVELQARRDYEALNTKYVTISKQYNVLRASKEAARASNVVKEDRIINEDQTYYAGECFDAIGLQHIQQSQQGTNTK